jgi:urocanate hydratase
LVIKLYLINMLENKMNIIESLPPKKSFINGIRRAPDRKLALNKEDIILAVQNALRYIPKEFHEELSIEFLEELQTMGRIYGYRFRPEGKITGKPIDEYKGITEAKAIQVMIDNNLDFDIALYPYELVTYGETGQVCQNWMQYLLIKKYLENMNEKQTLVIESGHPVGLFPSRKEAPRVIITNGLVIGKWDNPDDFKRLTALGVSNYGQMTAGGLMYIGPQGIVHGTYITLLNAGRKYLNIAPENDLKGIVFISSGLGGMSGAQPKACEIAGGIAIIAEVDYSRIKTRKDQGWVKLVSSDLSEIANWTNEYRKKQEAVSIAYHGNVIDLLEYFDKNDLKVELLSDQTSCHAVYEGGYTPSEVSFEEGRKLLSEDPSLFKDYVDNSLKRHFKVIVNLVKKGSNFWDYGNSFMASIFEAGEKTITKNGIDTLNGFIFPSYVEDIMGPICFDNGYGPFRWICLNNNENDLLKTDEAAMLCIDPNKSSQDRDNYNWIKNAQKNNLVVGTKARILYADEEGRVKLALKFNEMIRNGDIGPIMLGRDHHDVSGTDSPFRETSNIYDGSNVCADMATQCFAGNIARGMTMVVLSNGGGVGIGRSINGGNGIVLDGSIELDEVLKSSLSWDVMGGVARRNWERNENAINRCEEWNEKHNNFGYITIPHLVEKSILNKLLD